MDYASIAAKALAILKAKGTAVTLTRGPATVTGAVFNPEKGEYDNGSGDPVSEQTYALIQAPKLQDRGDRYFTGTEVQIGDRFLLLAAKGLDSAPKPGDTVTWDAGTFSIIASMPISPGGVDLLYRLMVRK